MNAVRTQCAVKFAAMLLVVGPAFLLAQGTSYITGYVLDESQAGIPDAIVTIANPTTGASVTLRTNEVGLYRSPVLAAGTYELTVSAKGFQRSVRHGVELLLGQPLGLDLLLKVGDVAELLEVQASAPLLRTEEAGLGQNVEYEHVQRLPYLNRTAAILLQLTPTVRYGGEHPLGYANSRFNAGGVGNANVMVNGLPVSGDREDVTQMIFNPSVDSLSEVRVVTSEYSAEYGQDLGVLVLMQTKSGTNRFHGGIYEYIRNEKLDSNDAFSGTRVPDRQNMFGGMLGGPIVKNKLFFFTHQEGQKESLPSGATLTVPTVAMKIGDFSGLRSAQGTLIPIYDPSTTRTDPATGQPVRNPFPGNVIPSDRIDSVARNIIKFWPNPNLPGSITGGDNLIGDTNQRNNKYRTVNRVDWIMTPSDTFAANWMIDKSSGGATGYKSYNAIEPAASPNQEGWKFVTQVYNFDENHIFGPRLFMSNRFSYRPRYLTRSLSAANPAKKWAETLGLKNYAGQFHPDWGGDLGFPTFNFTGYSSVGPTQLLFQEKPMHEFDYYHTITYIRGSHSIRVGFQMEEGLHGAPDQTYPTGQYTFAPTETALPRVAGTGNSIASFLLGQVDIGATRLGPLYRWSNWYYAAFFQDDWKVWSRLTVNLGLRWDIDAPVYEVLNQGNSFNLTKINPVSGTPGVITFKGRAGEPGSFYDTDWRRLAPRFGLAYRLKDKTVIRGGYGIYNAGPVLGANRRAPPLGFGISSSFSSPDGGVSPAFLLQQGFPPYPLGGLEQPLNDAFGAVPVGRAPATNVTFVQQSWKFGYSQNFNLSIQQQLPGNSLLEIAGQGVLGRNLSVPWEWNQVPPDLRGLPGNAQVRRPFPQFGNVTQMKRASGTIDYYAFTIRAEKRFSHGLSLIGNYVVSKSVGLLSAEDSYNPQLSRGPVLYQEGNNPAGQSYRLGLISWAYELPWGPGRRWANSGIASRVLGGWDVSGIYTYNGGVPFNIISGGDSLNCFCALASRVNLVGDLKAGPRNRDRWFNTGAVAAPAFGTVGTLGNGVLTSPANNSVNIAIGKKIGIYREKISSRFNAEIFNLTNTPQLGAPINNLRSPSFGRITSTNVDYPGVAPLSADGRIVQLGLRIEF